MSKEALKLALEALESCYSTGDDYKYQFYDDDLIIPAITAIKKALAQPDQEVLHIDRLDKWLDASLKERKQRTWVGLTDEEIWQTVTDCTIGGDLHADKFAKAIEAKLRSKNNG